MRIRKYYKNWDQKFSFYYDKTEGEITTDYLANDKEWSVFYAPSMMGIGHRESGGRRRSGDKLGRYHKHAWGRGGRLSQRDGAGAAPYQVTEEIYDYYKVRN